MQSLWESEGNSYVVVRVSKKTVKTTVHVECRLNHWYTQIEKVNMIVWYFNGT